MAKAIKLDWGKITQKINQQEKGFTKEIDERIYVPKIKEDGTFQGIIRFLWSPDTDIPFVKKFSHGFKGVGGWYIEDCPTTLGKECPVCKANTVSWQSDDKDTARQRARRLSCYANILIVKDPQTPENNGKVFLYRYGKKIHDKIMEKIQPAEGAVDEPIMIFDPYDGANFKLIIKTVKADGKPMANYDSSTFAEKTKIGTDEEIEKINKSLYNLSDFIAPDNFKSFDELQARFTKVLGSSNSAIPEQKQPSNDEKAESAESAPGEDEGVKDESNEQFFARLQKTN